jgi:DNA polymerase III epsilon subunit-like protein
MILLFIDTETTGLNPDEDHVVQLAARVRINSKTIDLNTYIQPVGFEIPESAQRIHGIDTAFAEMNGIPVDQALEVLNLMIQAADAVVGHHVTFDVQFLAAEARRAGRQELALAIEAKPQVCTKKMSYEYLTRCGEVATRSTTKLGTMFQRFTHEPLVDAHDAFTDVLACEFLHTRLLAS